MLKLITSMGPMQVLTFVLLLTSLVITWAAPPPSGYRATFSHIDSHGGFTKAELMRRAVHRSRHRASTMLSHYSTVSTSSNAGPARLRSGVSEYLMELAIGTPPVPFIALTDTGSDLIWTQCKPCKLCFPQDTPIYDSATSSSFSNVPCFSATCRPSWRSHNCTTASSPCRYRYSYNDDAYSAGVLGTETITFGSSGPGASVGGITFGCGVDNGGLSYNSTGTVGLGRGNLSLVTQLGVGKFSYCLTDFFNTSLSSPVLFGSLAELRAPGVQSTPLVQSSYLPSRYYISLKGISLGDNRLPIPKGTFDLRRDGSGGMIVDSGTTLTRLVDTGFRVVVDHVAGVLGQPGLGNASIQDSPCFPTKGGERHLPDMPDMVLHFAGGADMRLPRDSYMFFDEDQSLFCLAMVGSEAQYGSVLGNFQQQNIQMLFDMTVEKLSFVATNCGML